MSKTAKKSAAKSGGPIKALRRATHGAAWGTLGVTVSSPTAGAQTCGGGCSVYGNWTGAPITTLAATLVLPNGTTMALTAVGSPTSGDWQFNYPSGLPQLGVQYTVIIYDTTNPGTAVVVAFTCSPPTLSVTGIVTNEPIITLTGRTGATGISASGGSASQFDVKLLTDGEFEVSSNLTSSNATLNLTGRDATGKRYVFPSISVTVQSAPFTDDPSATVQDSLTLQVQWDRPMASTAFDNGIYTLTDTTSGVSVGLAPPVQVDFHTLNLVINDGTTFNSGDSYSLQIATSVTDQGGNPYTGDNPVTFTAP